MTNLDTILKSRDISLPTKVHRVKAMVFQVVMYGCESWAIKKAEHQNTDALELWCWRRLLRVPWAAKRSNQSILWEINPEYSLEGLMLRLKLQYFGRLMWRADSLENTPMLGEIEGRKRKGWQGEMVGWHHQLNGYEFEQTAWDGEGQGSLACCSPWGLRVGCDWSDWTRATMNDKVPCKSQSVWAWILLSAYQKVHKANLKLSEEKLQLEKEWCGLWERLSILQSQNYSLVDQISLSQSAFSWTSPRL